QLDLPDPHRAKRGSWRPRLHRGAHQQPLGDGVRQHGRDSFQTHPRRPTRQPPLGHPELDGRPDSHAPLRHAIRWLRSESGALLARELRRGLDVLSAGPVPGRVNYTVKDRYLLTVSGRVAGSSRLAPGQKYGVFPSVALAWRLSEEPFIRGTGLFSDLKLRASYGRTGNTAIDPYQTEGSLTRTMYSFLDQPAVGFRPGRLPNPDLRWEKTAQMDAGLEFTMANNRVSGSIDYYRADTRDLIMERQLPPTTGYSNILENVGATRNTGVEVALATLLVQDW